jgi:hypothetical protein
MACGAVILVATAFRFRQTVRHPKYHPPETARAGAGGQSG